MSKKGKQKNKSSFWNITQDWNDLKGVLLVVLGVFFLLSGWSFALHPPENNWFGFIGYGGSLFLHSVFGVLSFVAPLSLVWLGGELLFSREPPPLAPRLVAFLLLFFSLSMLLALAEDIDPKRALEWGRILYPAAYKGTPPPLSGFPALVLYRYIPLINLKLLVNHTGVFLLFGTLAAASTLFLLKLPVQKVVRGVIRLIRRLFERSPKEVEERVLEMEKTPNASRLVKLKIPTPQKEEPEALLIRPKKELSERPSLSMKIDEPKEKAKAAIEIPHIPMPTKQAEPGVFELPPLAMLTAAKKVDQSNLKSNLKKQAEVLEETLQSFGIEAKVGQINCGPTITSFEVHPSIGVKVQKIKTLENDIALNLEAKSIRIIAPIPGKAAVGIEVPNLIAQEVSYKEMLHNYQQGPKKHKIPLLLGKAVNGEDVVADLTKMPHCIIAGATGSGKSVCINTIIMSMLYMFKPDEVRLLMVDPKKVELTPYTRLPHLIAPVITEPHGAQEALNWMVREMEKRYEILKLVGVRNIDAFNTRTPDVEYEKSLNITIPEKLPYIVGIIDELADLMMAATSDIETPIARIAQMARAVGMHLILATQRPSREVITGLIKANFPTRISFKVSSRINSQIILDEVGAETLLGNGDMLFLPPGTSQLVRAQGAYISDSDIQKTIEWITRQAPTNYEIRSFDAFTPDSSSKAKKEDEDPLYKEALKVVMSAQLASASFLQRKMKIGYPTAARLIEQLEERGVVSEPDGSKARRVLTTQMPRFDDEE